MVRIVIVLSTILQVCFAREKTQNLARKNIDCTLSNYFQALGIKDYKRSEYHVKLQSGRVSKVRSGGAPARLAGWWEKFLHPAVLHMVWTIIIITCLIIISIFFTLPTTTLFFMVAKEVAGKSWNTLAGSGWARPAVGGRRQRIIRLDKISRLSCPICT